MSAHSPENDDDSWPTLDSLLKLQMSGDHEPLDNYIAQNQTNEEWVGEAMKYLIKTAGPLWDPLTTEKIWTTMFLHSSSRHRATHADDMIAFFEKKWEEFCGLTPKSMNKSQKEYALASAFGLLKILADVHNETAIQYLKEVLESCGPTGNDDIRFAATQSLELAKKLARSDESG